MAKHLRSGTEQVASIPGLDVGLTSVLQLVKWRWTIFGKD